MQQFPLWIISAKIISIGSSLPNGVNCFFTGASANTIFTTDNGFDYSKTSTYNIRSTEIWVATDGTQIAMHRVETNGQSAKDNSRNLDLYGRPVDWQTAPKGMYGHKAQKR